MKRIALVAAALLASACGGGKKTAASQDKTSTQQSAIKSSKASLVAKKPASPATQTALPSPNKVPATTVKTAGSTTVKAPDPTAGGTVGVNVYTFDSVNIDGNGLASGTVAETTDDSTMLVWYTGSFTASDGSANTYDALVWLDASNAGFIISFADSSGVACGTDASSNAGCVLCDTNGVCSATGLQ